MTPGRFGSALRTAYYSRVFITSARLAAEKFSTFGKGSKRTWGTQWLRFFRFRWPMEVFAMASIRVRPDTGLLFFDFRVGNRRFREQTRLRDTPANRKVMGKV